ncbi:MAG: DUF116 domain-containing protein [Candidatus Diapherotrites archaeon]|nr:DUF116 domain-containing protein [Candidatus Diapherotrites archaeon]
MGNGNIKKIRATISRLIDKGTHLDVSRTTEIIAKKFGLNQRLICYTHIELRNTLNEIDFKATPYPQRILFLPHCMKNSEKCRAKYTEKGLECLDCGQCQISELKKNALDLGYNGVYVTPGGSMVQKIIEQKKPKAVLGVCCYEEANIAFDRLRGTGIAPQAVLLMRDGCKDTIVNTEEVKEKMQMIDKKLLNNKA